MRGKEIDYGRFVIGIVLFFVTLPLLPFVYLKGIEPFFYWAMSLVENWYVIIQFFLVPFLICGIAFLFGMIDFLIGGIILYFAPQIALLIIFKVLRYGLFGYMAWSAIPNHGFAGFMFIITLALILRMEFENKKKTYILPQFWRYTK